MLSRDIAFTLAAFVIALLPRLFVAIAWAKEPVWDRATTITLARSASRAARLLRRRALPGAPFVEAMGALPGRVQRRFGLFLSHFRAELVVAPVLNALTGALLVAVVHRVARYYLSRDRARIAAGLSAMHPGLIAYSRWS